MKITINRQMKVILLKWLQQGYMNTDDLPDLNNNRDNWFLDLMKQSDPETRYTAEDLENVPTELLVQVTQYIQDARYKREQTKQ
ncbi:hypothetical protein [Mediterranea massiliensis]|uniref:hypothetical protein n=1 Tax=Mediterranea massiliensis TaxID=1841865 RepID=UPI00266BB144|nr:hypothetical protein [Mediterranea massiliensis]